MDRLKGKRAFLTATGAGIGRATAIAFAREGAEVIATDIRPELIADLKDHGIAVTDGLDVRSTAAVDAMAKKIGPVDILFNCAGFVHHGTVLTTIGRGVGLLLRHQRQGDAPDDPRLPAGHARAGRRRDRQHRLGRLLGARHPQPLRLRRLQGGGDRPDQGGRGRLHQAGHPGATRSAPARSSRPRSTIASTTQAKAHGKTVEEIRQAFVDRQPMGRLGKPEEIAALAVYLAGDESTYTTGQIFLADGGFAL